MSAVRQGTAGGGRGQEYFPDVEAVRFEGPGTSNPLAYRWYDPERAVLGKPMAEQLRIAVCAWHTFGGTGGDMFGAPAFDRAWLRGTDPMQVARQRLDAMMEFVRKLGVPFYVFHDRDVAPEARHAGRERREPRASWWTRPPKRRSATGVQAAVGHGQPVLPSALRGRRGDQPRSRSVRLRRARRCKTRWRRRSGSAARTTCCGAAARATTRCSTPISSARRSSSAASCTMVVEHKHKIGFTGHAS